MDIPKTKEGGRLILSPSGRIDTVTAPELEKAVNENIARIDKLVLDLKDLEYLSSAGLRVLLSAQKKMNLQGGMTAKNVNETIMEIFEVR